MDWIGRARDMFGMVRNVVKSKEYENIGDSIGAGQARAEIGRIGVDRYRLAWWRVAGLAAFGAEVRRWGRCGLPMVW